MLKKTGLVFLIFSAKTDKLVYVSANYKSIWGQDPDYLYKHSNSWIFQIDSEDYHRASHSITTRLRANYEFEEEFRIVNKSVKTPVKVSAFPVFCNAGCITYYFALFEDRSPYFKLQQDYQLNLDRFSYFFTHAPVALSITNQFGKFEEVNDSLCRLTGYSQQELSKLGWHDLIDGYRIRDYFAIAKELLDGKHSIELLKTIRTKQQKLVEISLKITVGQTFERKTLFNNQITDVRESKYIEQNLILERSHDRQTNLLHQRSFLDLLQRSIQYRQENSSFSFIVLVVSIESLEVIRHSLEDDIFSHVLKEIICRFEEQISGNDSPGISQR